MNAQAKYAFAALPLRALADERMTRSHIAVLGVVSHFDRFNKNGSGCYATQVKIGQMAHTRSDHVSRVMKDLVAWGYIEVDQQKDRRRKQYRVVHDPLNTCTTAQVSNGGTCTTAQGDPPWYLYDSANKDIPLRGKDIPQRGVPFGTDENIAPKGASIASDRRTTTLDGLIELAGRNELSFDIFKGVSVEELQGLAAQIDRNTRSGEVSEEEVWIALALRDAGEIVGDRMELGHLERVYEDAAFEVHGEAWDFEQTAADLLS
ncbi:helix-turn-helix domain-containing protein [Thioalkalivibrio sp. ALMg9]|uniref:MarR family transcriptional regulator n=1 Tax=Thioalkalivibrio sp. ALMg9 TaxID=1266912 RepID=UPI000369AE20|nr:helix-turn-helix domain-containing protein [Thioalkalivibrio sp. ALMg9]